MADAMLKIEDLDGGIRCIGLDRAAKRNAIGVELTLALEGILARTVQDRDLRVVVFHGIGGHFSAGMDMKDFFDSSTRSPELLRRARAATERWRTRLLCQLPQIKIAAVQGYCLGTALPILASSDIVLAGRDTRFGLPEINFGFVPGGQILKSAGTAMSRRGLAFAALTGRPFDVEQGRSWGLVTEVVDGDPLDHALTLARRLAGQPIAPASDARTFLRD
ncbi:enoyl-CoA hydratase/isomerase family protein [Piscinibacter sakaiensis]|uniref:enoyl-CoA hydratase/isomerase family protein n=1 Tax=Piscinibacter sakaiensis TaxID=1547922 RepID=UPI003AAF5002